MQNAFKMPGRARADVRVEWIVYSYQDGDKSTAMAMLGTHPVDSPEGAVKVAIGGKDRSAC